jgi:hypothetical protein
MSYRRIDKILMSASHANSEGVFRIFAATLVQALLLEPNDPVECFRIQLRLIAHRHYIDPERIYDERSMQKLMRLHAVFAKAMPVIATGDVLSYYTALSFDLFRVVDRKPMRNGKPRLGQRFGSHIRGILAAGLIVYVMHDDVTGHRDRPDKWKGLTTAKSEIADSYSSELYQSMFVLSLEGLDDAWKKYRRVAHLAAALLLFINKYQWTCFGAAEQLRWYREFGQYLAYAQYFQDFLKEIGSPQTRPRRSRYTHDLLELPAALGIQAWQPQKDERLTDLLPRPGKTRRARTASEISCSANDRVLPTLIRRPRSTSSRLGSRLGRHSLARSSRWNE